MNEATPAEFICPVCEEPLERAVDKCFRCQTELNAWWPLEASIQAKTFGELEKSKRSLWIPVVAAFLGGIAVYLALAMWLSGAGPGSAEEAASVSLEAPADFGGGGESRRNEIPKDTDKPRVETIYYRVQKGDSMWRIAAALKCPSPLPR